MKIAQIILRRRNIEKEKQEIQHKVFQRQSLQNANLLKTPICIIRFKIKISVCE